MESNYVLVFVVCAIIAWASQIFLGFFQMRSFYRAFQKLCQQGKVGIGRNSGRYRSKTLIAVALNEQGEIVDSLYMSGFSVFSRPRQLMVLHGKNYQTINPQEIFPDNKHACQALQQALNMQAPQACNL